MARADEPMIRLAGRGRDPCRWRQVSRGLLAALFVVAGVGHFVARDFYVALIPPYLPWPVALVYVSGVAEIIGGFGVLIRPVRRLAGWGLLVLLLAVFPANLHAAWHGFRSAPDWLLWLRLPLQFVLMAWVYWSCVRRPAGPADAPG